MLLTFIIFLLFRVNRSLDDALPKPFGEAKFVPEALNTFDFVKAYSVINQMGLMADVMKKTEVMKQICHICLQTKIKDLL